MTTQPRRRSPCLGLCVSARESHTTLLQHKVMPWQLLLLLFMLLLSMMLFRLLLLLLLSMLLQMLNANADAAPTALSLQRGQRRPVCIICSC
jgi:hypothetical protein